MKEQPYVLSNIYMKRDSDKLMIKLLNSTQKQYQLLAGSQPSAENITTILATSNNGDFEVIVPRKELPKYFIIKASDNSFSTNIFAERVIPLANAINVRDMGGYEANDGRFLKWGVLFRGDQLSKLDEDDQKLLTNYNLRTLVDYRSPHERQYHPNKFIPTVLQVLNCDPQSSFSEAAANVVDLKGENEKLVESIENGEVPEKYLNDRGENVIASYEDLVTSPIAQKAYGRLLKAIVREENLPLFHHCRGGKDRTGFGSMLVLLMLNIKDEDIIHDYLLTKIIRKERNQLKYDLYHQLVQKKEYLDYLMAMIDTREDYIKAAMNKIRKDFGSSDNYFQQHFGLTMAEINQARDFYLEEGIQHGE
ncbi:tyrosine-protein phosphatase [Lactobacillus sp. ESL0731]|uniref:tyrosine-protein phosphatase n=1 Tax=unclassified Lactobacillus TaxID=2620435 RepID=UPI0023F7659A|nr:MULTISPECIES: tyrosine-protein phosphatase [unclassified Lactobacillus]WEV51619.1 tyrosine-protein phosphatase [Lactobacillus sp. ESL0700]WEV62748.1 tyrosine-protein phosphatase [Lactobacillus sp. ESL0731]